MERENSGETALGKLRKKEGGARVHEVPLFPLSVLPSFRDCAPPPSFQLSFHSAPPRPRSRARARVCASSGGQGFLKKTAFNYSTELSRALRLAKGFTCIKGALDRYLILQLKVEKPGHSRQSGPPTRRRGDSRRPQKPPRRREGSPRR